MPQGEIDLLPFGNGKTVIGASHENDKGYDLQPDASVTDPMLEQALTWLPNLKEAATMDIRVGTRAYTSDFSPFFGSVPGSAKLLRGKRARLIRIDFRPADRLSVGRIGARERKQLTDRGLSGRRLRQTGRSLEKHKNIIR